MTEQPSVKQYNAKCKEPKYLDTNNYLFWIGIGIMVIFGALAIAMIFIDNLNYLTNWLTWFFFALVFVGLVITLYANNILNNCVKQEQPPM